MLAVNEHFSARAVLIALVSSASARAIALATRELVVLLQDTLGSLRSVEPITGQLADATRYAALGCTARKFDSW